MLRFVKRELNQQQQEAAEGGLLHTEWPSLIAALMEMMVIKPPAFAAWAAEPRSLHTVLTAAFSVTRSGSLHPSS